MRISDRVIYEVVDGETLVLDLATSRYFKLNQVATRALDLLTSRPDPSEVEDALLAEYDVERSRLHADIDQLIRTLVQEGLVTPDGHS